MAIATITPMDNTQQTLLAQALNGATGTLAQAINSAIQRGMQDANMQLTQENAFLSEQQRNIANERAERFDQRNRAQWLMDFARRERQDQLGNQINAQDADMRQEKFGFEREDREVAKDLNVTDPQIAAAKLAMAEEDQEIRRDEATGRMEIAEEGLENRRLEAQAKSEEREKEKAGTDTRSAYFRDLQEAEQITDAGQQQARREEILRTARADDALDTDQLKEIIERSGIASATGESTFTDAQRNTMLQRVSSIDAELSTASDDPENENFIPPGRKRVLERERARLLQQARGGKLTVDGPKTRPDYMDGFLEGLDAK